MKTLSISLSSLAFALLLPACGGDPNKPETWIAGLNGDSTKRAEAIDKLTKLIPAIEDESARADMEKKATEALIEAYKTDVQREAILKALALFKEEDAGPVFVDALSSWKEGVTDESARIAAIAAGDMKLKEAVPALIVATKADSMRLRLEAVRALGSIGTPETIDPLVAAMLADPDTQDFFVNRIAAEKLGEIGDPRAAPSIIRALFTRGRSANLFPFAAPSLIRLGPKVANPLLIEMINGKNALVNEDAKRLEFTQISMNEKAYEIMGLFFEADDETRAFLMKSMEADTDEARTRKFASEAIGRVGGPGAKEILLKYLADPKTDAMTKLQIQKGLYLLGDASVVPVLLEQAGPKGMTKDLYGNPSPILRIFAFEAITYLGGKKDIEALEKVLADAKADVAKGTMDGGVTEEMEKKMAGAAVVKECDTDAGCYAKKLSDPDETVVNMAACHLGVIGAKEKMKDLTDALDAAPGTSRVGITYAINRLHGEGADPKAIWDTLKRDDTLNRSFKKEEVPRDTRVAYWNVRRWTAK